MTTRRCRRAMSTRARTVSSEYTAPVGLFGLMTTIAWVFAVIFASMSSRSGFQPFALVAAVVDGRAARERDGAGPQGVVGRGHEDLVAVVDERLEHHPDELGHTVADVDVVDAGVGEAVGLVVLRDRGPGGVDALGVGVALALGEVVDHVGDDRLGCLEPERGGVPDVELEDLVALALEPMGLDEDRAAYVVAHVLELLALDDPTHGGQSRSTARDDGVTDAGRPCGRVPGRP